MTYSASPQQAVAIDQVNGQHSLVIEAVAGSGKTTTAIQMLKNITLPCDVAFCAFNKAIAQEIGYKVPQNISADVKVGTLHSFGFGAIRRAVSRVKVDGNKLREIARNEFSGDYENLRQFVINAAAMAKECGIAACVEDTYENWIEMCEHHNLWESLPDDVSDADAIHAAQYLLKRSNQIKNIIDFSDMIYMPIISKMKIWQYDYVFLDEAQDTNATRRALVKMMLKPGGKLIAVGDPHQAIYGFTGADSKALDNIREDFNAKTLPLTVTYRCPKNIVKVANRWVNHIQAADSAPEGVVDSCDISAVATMATKDDVIICRNTKPLIELAYNLIRKSVPCRVEGRAIGEGLIKLTKKWKAIKTVGQLSFKLEDWKDNEIARNKEKGNDSRCQIIEDQVETLMVFIDQCHDDDSVDILADKIRSMFGDTVGGKQDVLTLSTIHKSKGREWNRVFALGMDEYSPSKYAKKAWEMEQEDNLCYVQVTRAKNHLTMVTVPVKQKK